MYSGLIWHWQPIIAPRHPLNAQIPTRRPAIHVIEFSFPKYYLPSWPAGSCQYHPSSYASTIVPTSRSNSKEKSTRRRDEAKAEMTRRCDWCIRHRPGTCKMSERSHPFPLQRRSGTSRLESRLSYVHSNCFEFNLWTVHRSHANKQSTRRWQE